MIDHAFELHESNQEHSTNFRGNAPTRAGKKAGSGAEFEGKKTMLVVLQSETQGWGQVSRKMEEN